LDYFEKDAKRGRLIFGRPFIKPKMAQLRKWLSECRPPLPEVVDTRIEPDYIYEQYGEDSKKQALSPAIAF